MSSIVCSLCNGTGWMPTTAEAQGGVVRCECYRRARIPRLTEFARIPPHYATATLQNYDTLGNPSLEMALNAAQHFVQEYPMIPPQGLLFMGPPGLGKTHLAVGIIRALIDAKSIACLFCDFPDLLREIQNSYNPLTHGSEALILAPILDADVLVLDDLGSQKWSEWVQDMVGHVINDRYRNGHATILTTNYLDPLSVDPQQLEQSKIAALKTLGVMDEAGNIDQFKMRQLQDLGVSFGSKHRTQDTLRDRIGDRVRSRLIQMCRTVRMSGDDFRRSIGTRKIR